MSSTPGRFDSPTLANRREQMFPTLTPGEIEAARRFATPRRYRDGEHIFETGKPAAGLHVIVSGVVRITGRDGHGHDLPITEHRAGNFAGEIAQLSGAPAWVDGIAVGDVEALVLDSERLRRLLMAEAQLGEKLMRTLILRRMAIVESGAGGPVIVGAKRSAEVLGLRNFLRRNTVPHVLLDPDDDADAREIASHYSKDDLPVVVCADGSVLRKPSEIKLASCIGMLDGPRALRYDIAIVGAGPAGLSTAVYAASEGLSVVVIDAKAFGGQAGASARIENYLGFPTGISGMALTGRAFVQAQKFGVRMIIPAEVRSCGRDEGGDFILQLAEGEAVRSRTVVVATGARYRRPDHPELKAMEGHGVMYWASPLEASVCAGEEVVLVGGGNSAGQAAVFLSGYAKKVWMLVRGKGLAASMSSYLIERIEATENIELLTQTEIVHVARGAQGDMESVTWRHRGTGAENTRPVRNVFLFLGADPSTEWLAACGAELDAHGFIVTGRSKASLESSVPGMFAVGDVRSGSTKRVGAAIGEGAAAVNEIHAYLALSPQRSASASGSLPAQG